MMGGPYECDLESWLGSQSAIQFDCPISGREAQISISSYLIHYFNTSLQVTLNEGICEQDSTKKHCIATESKPYSTLVRMLEL